MAVRVQIKVVPGASRTRLAGKLGDAFKLAVAEPAESGRANRAVVDLLAEVLGVSASSIRIVQGTSSPRKTVEVDGLDEPTILARLSAR
jgi:uncharacterized protein (TIGR00251 family)